MKTTMSPAEFLNFASRKGYKVTRYRKWQGWLIWKVVGGWVTIGEIHTSINKDVTFRNGLPTFMTNPHFEHPDHLVEDPCMEIHQKAVREAKRLLKLS